LRWKSSGVCFPDSSLERIKEDICIIYTVKDAEILKGKRGTNNIASQVVLVLSKEFSGMKLSEMGVSFSYFS
jgi:hypothetical protein